MFKTTIARLRLHRPKAETSDSTYSQVDAKTTPSLVEQDYIANYPDERHPEGLTWRQTYWRQGPVLGISARTDGTAEGRLAFTDGLEVTSPHRQQRFAE
ncbi:hypothetical protein Q7P37_010875 [Cladosporium fusiforme]